MAYPLPPSPSECIILQIYSDYDKCLCAYKITYILSCDYGINSSVGRVYRLMNSIGHDMLHRKEAVKAGGFNEFNIFDMRDNRMEY